jgi:hypothetical protein
MLNENDFEQFIRDLPLDDQIDPAHRDRLEKQLLCRHGMLARQPKEKHWRTIMKNNARTIQSAAAVLILGAVLLAYLGLTPVNKPMDALGLISQAHAAEARLFTGSKIVHLLNEIIVFPVQQQDETLTEEMQRVNTYLASNWMPVCTLSYDGQLRPHQLNMEAGPSESYTIRDHAWYDPETGRCSRVMRTDDQILLANAWDGVNIYESIPGPGPVSIEGQTATADFQPPVNPAAFLGIGAGIRTSGTKDKDHFNILDQYEDALDDGTAVEVFKMGYVSYDNRIPAYILLKIRVDDGVIAEIAFYQADQLRYQIRRILTEQVDQPEIAWNLDNLEIPDQRAADAPVSVRADMVVPDATVASMTRRADFPTYIFAQNPSWTGDLNLIDVLDVASPPKRMFIARYQSRNDERHLVMVQSHTYNMMMDSLNTVPSWLSTSNGMTVWGGGPEQAWWTGIVLKAAQVKAADDRIGCMIKTPGDTWIALVINGPIDQDQLQALIETLIPAEDYIEPADMP